MRLIANCQLHGEYGLVIPGDMFEARDEVAKQLIRNGNARSAEPPTIAYETQVLQPEETPEVRPEHPFRDMHVPDKESETVAPARDPVLSDPDVSKPAPRTIDRGRRGGRR